MRRSGMLLGVVVAFAAGVRIAPAAPGSPEAKRRLQYLPADADLVMHVDIAMLRKKPSKARLDAGLLDIVKPAGKCAYDPTADVETVALAVMPRVAIFVIRGVDRDKLRPCLREKTDANGFTTLAKFVDAKTLVKQVSKTSTKTPWHALPNDSPLVTLLGIPFGGSAESDSVCAGINAITMPGPMDHVLDGIKRTQLLPQSLYRTIRRLGCVCHDPIVPVRCK